MSPKLTHTGGEDDDGKSSEEGRGPLSLPMLMVRIWLWRERPVSPSLPKLVVRIAVARVTTKAVSPKLTNAYCQDGDG